MPVRPTLRCVREDLDLPIPSARAPLDRSTTRCCARRPSSSPRPIPRTNASARSTTSSFFKVKVGRWRGAVFTADPDAEVRDWLVAAGTREDGYKAEYGKPLNTADAWFPEYALPERDLLPAEQAWSNLMDPKAAAKLLDDQPRPVPATSPAGTARVLSTGTYDEADDRRGAGSPT